MGGRGKKEEGREEGRRFFHIMFPLSTQEKLRAFKLVSDLNLLHCLNHGQREDAPFHTPFAHWPAHVPRGCWLQTTYKQRVVIFTTSRVTFSLMLNAKYHPDRIFNPPESPVNFLFRIYLKSDPASPPLLLCHSSLSGHFAHLDLCISLPSWSSCLLFLSLQSSLQGQ